MARLSLTLSQLTTKTGVEDYTKNAAVRTDGNVLVDSAHDPHVAKVTSVCTKLLKSSVIPCTRNNNVVNYALLGINAFGCSIIASGEFVNPTYSLVSTQIDSEVVDNPNKIDEKQFVKLEKVGLSMEEILKNNESAFYTPDADKSLADTSTPKAVISSQPLLACLPNLFGTLVDVNSNLSTPSLRAFRGVIYG